MPEKKIFSLEERGTIMGFKGWHVETGSLFVLHEFTQKLVEIVHVNIT
jgi:hypothetical protein